MVYTTKTSYLIPHGGVGLAINHSIACDPSDLICLNFTPINQSWQYNRMEWKLIIGQ